MILKYKIKDVKWHIDGYSISIVRDHELLSINNGRKEAIDIYINGEKKNLLARSNADLIIEPGNGEFEVGIGFETLNDAIFPRQEAVIRHPTPSKRL